MLRQQFETKFMTSIHNKIPDNYLHIIRDMLSIAMSEYEITKRNTEIVPLFNPIPECLEIYIIAKKTEGIKNSSIKLYLSTLKNFFTYVDKNIEEIDTCDIRKYLYTNQKLTNSCASTMATKRTIISQFFSWCEHEGYIRKDPCRSIKPIKYTKNERVPLTSTELEMIRNACVDIRERAMIEFVYSTGCRVSELKILQKSDIDFLTNEVQLFGKGDKRRKSYITQKAMMYLKMYLDSRDDDNPHLFVSMRAPHGGLTKDGIERIFKKIGERSGINRRLFPHLLRHTTATDCLSRGMSVAEIQRILGHADISTTMKYAKVCDGDIKHKHEKCIA